LTFSYFSPIHIETFVVSTLICIFLFYIPRGSFFGEGLFKNMAMLVAVYVVVFSIDFMYRRIEHKKALV